MPPPIHMVNPTFIITEIIYTALVFFICLIIFLKTKEIYTLTEHKGIKYFRFTFLFLGLAYALRLKLQLVMLSFITFDVFIPRKEYMPLAMVFVSIFSTLAIVFLIYSLIHKRSKLLKTFFYAITIIFSVITYLTRSHEILILLQLALIITAVWVIYFLEDKKYKKFSTIKFIYFLLLVFWLINVFMLQPKTYIPLELKLLFQIVSIIIFIIILHKINKWIK